MPYLKPSYEECLEHSKGGGNKLSAWIRETYPDFYDSLPRQKGIRISQLIYDALIGPGKCLRCGTPTVFRGFAKGYSPYCSTKCSNAATAEKRSGISTLYKEPKAPKELKAPKEPKEPKEPKQSKASKESYKEKAPKLPKEPKTPIPIKPGLKLPKGIAPCTTTWAIPEDIKWQPGDGKNILGVSGDKILCKCPHEGECLRFCKRCTDPRYITTQEQYDTRKKDGVETCTKLYPFPSNVSEQLEQVYKWLDEWGIEYTKNDDTIVPDNPVDIYVPSKHVAIDMLGIYKACTRNSPIPAHMNKCLAYRKQGVQLISCWEDQIYSYKDRMMHLLMAKLGVYNETVMARKCELREVGREEASAFQNKYHLQGGAPATWKYGLYYNNELMCMMTFGYKRAGIGAPAVEPGSYELIRFCAKAGARVQGGGSKLLKHFVKTVNPKVIYSYSSNDISDGKLYKSLGFEGNGESSAAYWYIQYIGDKDPMHRWHRFSFTRQSCLVRFGETEDRGQTERMMTDAYNMYRIYDCGQLKWVYKNQNYIVPKPETECAPSQPSNS